MFETNLGESARKNRMTTDLDSYPKRRRSRGSSPKPTAVSVVDVCSDRGGKTCGSSAAHGTKNEASLHLCESNTSRSDDAEPATRSTNKTHKAAKKASDHVVEHRVTRTGPSVRPPPQPLLLSAIDAKHTGTSVTFSTSSSDPSSSSSACAGAVPGRHDSGTSNLHSEGAVGNLKRSSRSSSRSSRSVQWDSITIHMHHRELGDNPSCAASGPPVTLGWKPFQSRTLDLDSYEERRPERRQKEEMIAPPEQREVRRHELHMISCVISIH